MNHKYANTNLFNATECPSDEVLLRYSENKLDKAELRQVELHCIDCEMCSDTLEGIQKSGAQHIRNEQTKVEQVIDKRIFELKKENTSRSTWYFAAAAIALLISASFIYRLYFSSIQETEIALSNNKVEEEVHTLKDNASIDTTDLFKAAENDQAMSTNKESAASSNNNAPIAPQKQSEEYVNAIVLQEENDIEHAAVISSNGKGSSANAESSSPSPVSNFSVASGNIAEKAISDNLTPATARPSRQVVLETSEVTKDEIAVAAKKKQDIAKKETTKAAPVTTVVADSPLEESKIEAFKSESIRVTDDEERLNTAEILYKNKKYSLAAKEYQKVLNTLPNNCKALLGSARSNFVLNDYTKAQHMIEQLATLNCGKINDEAWLVAAAIALKQDKIEEAKVYLQKGIRSVYPNIAKQAQIEFDKLH